MTRMLCFVTVAAFLLATCGIIAAADSTAIAEPETAGSATTADNPASPSDAAADNMANDDETADDASDDDASDDETADSREDFFSEGLDGRYFMPTDAPYEPELAARFGWWGVHTRGSTSNVGEWQGLDSSSPFWDVDGLRSNGYETIDFFATGTENESTQGSLHLYMGPRLSVDVDYDRFLHRLGHKPLGGTDLPYTPGDFPLQGGFFDTPLGSPASSPGSQMWGEDLNIGQDYALRVQQLSASFQGDLTENLRWRLNIWGLKKEGMRQVNSMQHCFNPPSGSSDPAGPYCHAVSRGQHVNWLTMEIEPVVEARFGWLTVEYSRTMRSFQQSDEIVTGDFRQGNNGTYGLSNKADNAAFAYVPENYTEIDRIKLRGELAPETSLYVVSHLGNTHNEFRGSDRKFYGVDARLTNTSVDGLSVTAYGRANAQRNSEDTQSLSAPGRFPGQEDLWAEYRPNGTPVPPQGMYNPTDYYQNLVDRDDMAVGVKARWRPFYDATDLSRGLAVTGGYEYSQLERTNVSYNLALLNPPVLFTQPTTQTHMGFVGVQQEWNRALSSYIRYRLIERQWPLVGVTHRTESDLDAAINSNLPAHEDRIEVGGTWSPADNLMLNGSVWLINSYNHSDLVNFDEDSYPIVLSAWYGMNERWSFNGGFATFSNWITQDITLGREDGLTTNEARSWTSPWDYAGRADVFNLGASFLVTCRLTLVGGVEYVRSRNVFADPGTPPPENQATNPLIPALPYSDLPGYSAVRVNTLRLTAGADYELARNINTFFRYNYFDYDDRAMLYNAGTAHMFLAGLSGVF